MANFETLKTAIDANINTNGKQAITGSVVNNVMHQMVDATSEQLTELESETNRINIDNVALRLQVNGGECNIENISFNDGRIWNPSNNSAIAYAPYKYSDKVNVTGIDYLEVIGANSIDINAFPRISVYGDGEFVGSFLQSEELSSKYSSYKKLEVVINAPIDNEVSVIAKNSQLSIITRIADNEGKTTELEGKTTELEYFINGVQPIRFDILDKKLWIATSRTTTGASGYFCTDEIDITEYDRVLVKGSFSVDASVLCIALYGDGELISSYKPYGNGLLTTIINVAQWKENYSSLTIVINGKEEFPIEVKSLKDNNVATIAENPQYTFIRVQRNAEDFNSIRETIDAITDASADNPYCVIVPKGRWFECDIQGKDYVILRGEDVNESIIYCDGQSDKVTPKDYSFGAYNSKPLKDIPYTQKHIFNIQQNFTIENLSVISATIVNGEFAEVDANTKYCVHLDSASYAYFKAYNCIFRKYDKAMPQTIGTGVRTKLFSQSIEFDRCKFITRQIDNAGIYIHNDSNVDAKHTGKFVIKDCAFNGDYLSLGELGSEYQCQIDLINCKSKNAFAKIGVFVERNGDVTYWKNPTTGQFATGDQQTLLPYSLKLNTHGTKVANITWGNQWGGGNPRPDFIAKSCFDDELTWGN